MVVEDGAVRLVVLGVGEQLVVHFHSVPVGEIVEVGAEETLVDAGVELLARRGVGVDLDAPLVLFDDVLEEV